MDKITISFISPVTLIYFQKSETDFSIKQDFITWILSKVDNHRKKNNFCNEHVAIPHFTECNFFLFLLSKTTSYQCPLCQKYIADDKFYQDITCQSKFQKKKKQSLSFIPIKT